MAETQSVKVLEKKDRNVRLRLYLLIPEVTQFCVTKNCALQILWDKAHPAVGRSSPLGDAITADNRRDARWLLANQDRFIESVCLLETANYPASSDLIFSNYPYNLKVLPQATIEIVVTDKRWIAHLRRGASWGTVPLDAGSYQ
jgi:hypothetical protein